METDSIPKESQDWDTDSAGETSSWYNKSNAVMLGFLNFYMTVCLILAIFSPIATFILMHSIRWKRSINYSMLMMIISVMDLLVCVYVLVPQWIHCLFGVQVSNSYGIICRALEGIGHITITNSSALIVLISIERYFYTTRSYLYTKFFSDRTIDRYAMVMIGFDGGLFLMHALSFQLNKDDNCETTSLVVFSSYMWAFLTAMIPFGVVAYVVAVIIHSKINETGDMRILESMDSVRPYMIYGTLYTTCLLIYACNEIVVAHDSDYLWHPKTYFLRTLGTTGIQMSFFIHCFGNKEVKAIVMNAISREKEEPIETPDEPKPKAPDPFNVIPFTDDLSMDGTSGSGFDRAGKGLDPTLLRPSQRPSLASWDIFSQLHAKDEPTKADDFEQIRAMRRSRRISQVSKPSGPSSSHPSSTRPSSTRPSSSRPSSSHHSKNS